MPGFDIRRTEGAILGESIGQVLLVKGILRQDIKRAAGRQAINSKIPLVESYYSRNG
jgi:hypothetical protein